MSGSESAACMYVLDVPLQDVFAAASGFVSTRSVGLIRISVDGLDGWGEAAPFPGQDESFTSVVEAARAGSSTATLSAAIDEAMSDLVARQNSRTLLDDVGAAVDRVPASVAVGLGENALTQVRAAVDSGIMRVKIKIAPGRVSHVREIHENFPELSIGLDANGSFDESSMAQLDQLLNVDAAYLEQPFTDLSCDGTLRLEQLGFSVFADESVRSLRDAGLALATPGVAGVVVKPGRLGWSGSLAAVAAARSAGKLWRASSLLETGIGRVFPDLLASAQDSYLSDTAPADWFMDTDIVDSRFSNGFMSIPGGAGTGLSVSRETIESIAVSVVDLTATVWPRHG